MGQDVRGFITAWVQENVVAGAYEPLGDMSTAGDLADLCRAEAREVGIADQDLDATADGMTTDGRGLTGYLADAMEHRTREASKLLPSRAG